MFELQNFKRRFFASPQAVIGTILLLVLLLPAIFAPLLANGKPLLIRLNGQYSLPFLQSFLAPETSEKMVETLFNFLAAALPVLLVLQFARRWIKNRKVRFLLPALFLLMLTLPFGLTSPRLDHTDYRTLPPGQGDLLIFAPIPYGPDEPAAAAMQTPCREHWLGTDAIGRDVAARMLYGSRISLAVGIIATLISAVIGITIGLCCGYWRTWIDLLFMRIVEMLLCFPTFLLLLILMSYFGDGHSSQSLPLVIGVIGLTGWISMAFLVRGEVLKQCTLPYIQSCRVTGMSDQRIMFRHLLPNVCAPVIINFTFGVAGAILSESGLSFLGFGVQPPTSSWGNLLRQAFEDPFLCWHLTFFPGLAIFLCVLAFNFIGEGLRKAFSDESGQ